MVRLGFPADDFRAYLGQLTLNLQSPDGLWLLRGFVDTARHVYSLNSDTKVISKALELMLFPFVADFCRAHRYGVVTSAQQNFYPDLSLVGEAADTKFALDLKTTYRTGEGSASGFTLGAFTGYFRQRSSAKNITFPYREYHAHYVIGVVYTQLADLPDPAIYSVDEVERIAPAIRNIEIVFHEKWQVAGDRPGSGNTKNIGSITRLPDLREGRGPFTLLGNRGEEIFNRYWQEYLTADMARAAETKRPFQNLREYLQYRNLKGLLKQLEAVK